MATSDDIITHTQHWIKSVVIDCNFCPFAARVYQQQSIHYTVGSSSSVKDALQLVQTELEWLDANASTETSFVIFQDSFEDFDDYLGLVKKAGRLLTKEGYDGIYQIASFHPRYCFRGSDEDDAANYTNRSPYPMLHLLREDSLEKALRFFSHPEMIPENNIAFARSKGLAYMQMLLASCL